MADAEPGKGARRLAIGIAAIALAAVFVVLLVRGGGSRPVVEDTFSSPSANTAPAPAPPSAQAPLQPIPSSAGLDRDGLLTAARAAASAYAQGAAPSGTVAALGGRRFQLRLPFGCEGPATADTDGAAFWALGPDGDTLRVSVRPEVWTDSPFAQLIGGEGVEAVEGFWIPRPWQASETCPARRTDPLLAEAPPASPQTVGLATVFGPASSRVGRRGERPYELTLPLTQADRPGREGLQIVLEGRVAPFADGRAIACRSAGPDQRPVCLIGAQLDRVAVRNPVTEAVLGEWRDAAALNPLPARPSSPAASAGAGPPG